MASAVTVVAEHPFSAADVAAKLGAEITELCSYIYAAEARLLELIREFDEHEYWAQLGMYSCAHWLNFKCGIGMNAAREKVRVARALATLPKIARALRKGELSYSKVRAMTRIADESNEDYLLMIARHGTAHHVEKLVSTFRTAKRLQDPELVRASHENRYLSYYYDEDGALVMKARMPAEQGALVVKALEQAMDAAFADAGDAGDVTAVTPVDTQLACDHVEESTDSVPDDVFAETPAPASACRADALANIAETYLSNKTASGSTPDRYQVVLHVTAETSQFERGPCVTAETSRRIACDSSVVRAETGTNDEPLSIGRRSRSIPPAIRRALWLRDGGCRFPGCTRSRFVDGHHLRHWANGGETSLDNLVLLCRHHHRLVHEGGFACRRSDSGDVCFENQRGEQLPRHVPLPGASDAEDVLAWFERRLVDEELDAEACVANWYAGDRMDWQTAVSALF